MSQSVQLSWWPYMLRRCLCRMVSAIFSTNSIQRCLQRRTLGSKEGLWALGTSCEVWKEDGISRTTILHWHYSTGSPSSISSTYLPICPRKPIEFRRTNSEKYNCHNETQCSTTTWITAGVIEPSKDLARHHLIVCVASQFELMKEYRKTGSNFATKKLLWLSAFSWWLGIEILDPLQAFASCCKTRGKKKEAPRQRIATHSNA